ncbi:MAG: GAF domain-containing protein [candidate division WOR-3 bacterium]
MEKEKKYKEVIEKIKSIDQKDRNTILKKTTEILQESFEYFDWVGFYLVKDGKLILSEFVGEPTVHTKINFGEGICGQAAERKKTFIVKDVSKEKNYLSCSTKVKSEIVVPIFKNQEIVGELDIDSHTLNAFDETDKINLEKICKYLEKFF